MNNFDSCKTAATPAEAISPLRRLGRKILLTLVTVAALFIVLELTIRVINDVKDRGFFSLYRNKLAQPLRPVIPFRTFGSPLYHREGNALKIVSRFGEKYPFEKGSNTFRVVCFGGSTTEWAVEGLHYPILLQHFLQQRYPDKKIEAINLGFSGYTTAHALILLELDVLSWQPDLVILSENVNDREVMYWPNFTFDYSNKYGSKYFTIPDYAATFTIPNVLLQWSQLYWFVHEKLARVREQRKLRQAKTDIHRRSYGPEPSPEALEVFRRNLNSFVAVARQNGIPVILASQPIASDLDFFLKHKAFKPYNDVIVYPLHEEYMSHHRIFNDAIAEVAAAQGVYFLDNATLFGNNLDLFEDWVHYSKKGLKQIARNYEEFIVGNRLVELKPGTRTPNPEQKAGAKSPDGPRPGLSSL